MENIEKYSTTKTTEKKELKLDIKVPIIDIIRHGSSEYKELKSPDFKFEPQSPNFKLDKEHLDLTEKGIEEINETAEQIGDLIDKENEVVILIASPAFRTRSSILLLEEHLKQKGINILNLQERILKSKALRPVSLKEREEGLKSQWITKDKEYRLQGPENIKRPPDEAHIEIAKMLGRDISDIFTEDYSKIDLRFKRFLRHITNIYYWLQNETKENLKDKKIRFICLTHEEVPVRLMKQSLGSKENIKNGQILEIKPTKFLESKGTTEAKIILYPKGKDSESGESDISIRFTSNK